MWISDCAGFISWAIIKVTSNTTPAGESPTACEVHPPEISARTENVTTTQVSGWASADPLYSDEGKEMPKMYHCRICGRPYISNQEAKACQRDHEWQNRKGRR